MRLHSSHQSAEARCIESVQLHSYGNATGHLVSDCLRANRRQSGAVASLTSDEGRHF